MRRKQADHRFVLCVQNDHCDDLEKRKVYRVISDEKAEKDGYVRVIDESGEDYLYPVTYFVRLQLPRKRSKRLSPSGSLTAQLAPHHGSHLQSFGANKGSWKLFTPSEHRLQSGNSDVY